MARYRATHPIQEVLVGCSNFPFKRLVELLKKTWGTIPFVYYRLFCIWVLLWLQSRFCCECGRAKMKKNKGIDLFVLGCHHDVLRTVPTSTSARSWPYLWKITARLSGDTFDNQFPISNSTCFQQSTTRPPQHPHCLLLLLRLLPL